MGALQEALGKQQAAIDFEGATYTLTELTLDEWSPFEVWLEQEAYRGAMRVKKNPAAYGMTDAEAQANFERVSGEVAAQRYSFGAPAFIEATGTLAGKKQICWMMLVKNHPSTPKAVVDKMFHQMFGEVLAAMDVAEGADPNAKPPPAPAGEEASTSPKSSPASPASPGATTPSRSAG